MNIKIDEKSLETLNKMAEEKQLALEDLIKNILDDAIKNYDAKNQPLAKPKIFKRPF